MINVPDDNTPPDAYKRAADAITAAFSNGVGALAPSQDSMNALGEASAQGAGLMQEIGDSIELKSRSLFDTLQFSHLPADQQKIAESCMLLANIWLNLPGNEEHRERLRMAMDPFDGNEQEAEMLMPAPAKYAKGMISSSAGVLGRLSELKGRIFSGSMDAWERSPVRSLPETAIKLPTRDNEERRRAREPDTEEP